MNKINKLISALIISIFIFGGLSFASIGSGGGVEKDMWCPDGLGNIQPCNTSWGVKLPVGGTTEDDFYVNGYNIIMDTDGDSALTNDRDVGVADDEIGITLASDLDFLFSANDFVALSGSTISTNTINETDGGNGVIVDSWTLKDGGATVATGGTNTFNITNGTASIDLASGSVADINANLTVSNSFTVGTTNGGTLDFTGASKTLNVEDDSTVNQDLTSDASVTFGEVAIDNAVGVLDFTGVTSATISSTGSGLLTIDDPLVVDVTDTEALLVRKDSDGGDIFTVDTTNENIETSALIVDGGATGNYGGFGGMTVHNNDADLNWDTVFMHDDQPDKWFAYYIYGTATGSSYSLYSYDDLSNAIILLGAGDEAGIRINPNPGGVTKIGTSTPSTVSTRDDLYVTGDIETGSLISSVTGAGANHLTFNETGGGSAWNLRRTSSTSNIGFYTSVSVDKTFEFENAGTGNVIISQDALKRGASSEAVADDGTIDLPDATSGWGYVMAGDNEEFARFRWTTAGVVTLDESTTNVVSTDTDANLCIFDNGTSVRIRNRLGASKTIKYVINY